MEFGFCIPAVITQNTQNLFYHWHTFPKSTSEVWGAVDDGKNKAVISFITWIAIINSVSRIARNSEAPLVPDFYLRSENFSKALKTSSSNSVKRTIDAWLSTQRAGQILFNFFPGMETIGVARGAKGAMASPKFLEFTVILCFVRRYP